MSLVPIHLAAAVCAVEDTIDALGKQESLTRDPDIWKRVKRLRLLLRQLRSSLYIERKAAGLAVAEPIECETSEV